MDRIKELLDKIEKHLTPEELLEIQRFMDADPDDFFFWELTERVSAKFPAEFGEDTE